MTTTSSRRYPDMWVDPEDDPRETDGPGAAGEKDVLAEYLDRYRRTLELKCEGLDADQLARRSVPPSTMSLLGLVRHLARVEQSWFRRVLEQQRGPPAALPGRGRGLRLRRADAGAGRRSLSRCGGREVAHAREVYADLDLDAVVAVGDDTCEARDIIVHMVEEYARHVGHADLLRECIDGRTGQ